MTNRLRASISIAMTLTAILAGCQAAAPTATIGPATSTPAATSATSGPSASLVVPPVASPSAAPAAALHVLALGDSSTTGSGDPAHKGWAAYYAALVEQATGHAVGFANAARNGTTTAALLDAVRTSTDLRTRIAGADIILLGIGGADLNAGDDAMASGSCEGVACYEDIIHAARQNLAAVVDEIRMLNPTALMRAIGFPNGYPGAATMLPDFIAEVAGEVGPYQAKGLTDAVCAAMERGRGACVGLLEAFNGTDGMGDPYAAGLFNLRDCCYPNENGHRLIAKLVFETGLGSLSGG